MARKERSPPSRSRIARAIARASESSVVRELDVERNEDLARADGDRTGADVAGDVAFVGQPAGVAADRRQQAALGAAGRGAVIKGRYPEALPDPCARPVSESCGLFQARSAQWNERKHVERAHPRMEAAVPAKVDPLERDAGKFDRGIEHLRCVTHDR